MDRNQMMTDALKSYGASNTPANIAQMQRFFASNPDQLERRAMGMRGSNGNEDNTDVLGLQLDKLMQASDRPAQAIQQEPLAPPQEVTQQSVSQARSTPTPALVPTQGLQYNPNHNLGPLPPKPGTPYRESGFETPADASYTQRPEGGKDWLGPMLMTLLGLSSVAGRNGVGPGGMGPHAPNGPANGGGASPELTNVAPGRNAVGKAVPALPNDRAGQKLLTGPQARITDQSSPQSTVTRNSPELEQASKTAQLQSEIDAENKSMSATEKAQADRIAKQKETADLAKRARQAVGRK